VRETEPGAIRKLHPESKTDSIETAVVRDKRHTSNGMNSLSILDPKEGKTIPPRPDRRKRERIVAQPRWSSRARARARDYLLSVVELTTNRRWENRLPVERTARRPNDFSPWLQRAFQRHEFAPRRELMETRRGMPYALIKRDARASSLSAVSRDSRLNPPVLRLTRERTRVGDPRE